MFFFPPVVEKAIILYLWNDPNSCLQGQQSCDIRGTDPLTNSYLWDCLCCRGYKKQIEEAEEIAALNLAKFRKVAGALGDAEAVADANEQVGVLDTYYVFTCF